MLEHVPGQLHGGHACALHVLGGPNAVEQARGAVAQVDQPIGVVLGRPRSRVTTIIGTRLAMVSIQSIRLSDRLSESSRLVVCWAYSLMI